MQYSCTSKLATVMANQPQLIMVSATPALSELYASGQRQRLLKLVITLTLGMLTVSGLIACLVLALNAAFVGWWVGPAQYGGDYLTLAGRDAAASAALEHHAHLRADLLRAGAAGVDHEPGRRRRLGRRRLGLTSVLGVSGAVVGSIAAVALTSLPCQPLRARPRNRVPPGDARREVWPWGSRVVRSASLSVLLPWLGPDRWGLHRRPRWSAAVYAIMAHGLEDRPLGEIVKPRLVPLLAAV